MENIAGWVQVSPEALADIKWLRMYLTTEILKRIIKRNKRKRHAKRNT